MTTPSPPTGRYVILWHQLPSGGRHCESGRQSASGRRSRGDHYDWMFETQGQLLTWASQRIAPPDQPLLEAAIALPPHRIAYLDYEGAISGGRGAVRRVERGVYRRLLATADRFECTLHGERSGRLRIYRTASSDSWTIAFEPNFRG